MSPPGKSNLPAKQLSLDANASKPFPLLLHTSKQARPDTLGNFPAPSPLASPVKSPPLNKGKERALVPHQDEDDSDELAREHEHTAVQINGTLRPFPMNSGEMKSAARRIIQSPSGSVGSKRTSDDSDGELGRAVKRHKEDNTG
jgi:hypothetical protein